MKRGKRYCSSRVEWKYINQLIEKIENENIRYLVTDHLMWHVIRADRYRTYEHLLNLAAVLTPTMMLVFNYLFAQDDILKQVLAVGAGTATASAQAFSKLHEKKVLYRNTAEKIKNETILYISKTDKYKVENRDEKFILTVNEIVEGVNSRWQEIEDTVMKVEDNGV